jgi:hypothetical protein
MFRCELNHYHNYCACKASAHNNSAAHCLVVAVHWYKDEVKDTYKLRQTVYKGHLEMHLSFKTNTRPVAPVPPRFPAWWDVSVPWEFGWARPHTGLFRFRATPYLLPNGEMP